MDADTEAFILLLLADGNLPTGSFVASSGLESFITHGFFDSHLSVSTDIRTPQSALANRTLTHYISDNLDSYGHSALPFVADAHAVARGYVEALSDDSTNSNEAQENALRKLRSLDALYECMTLNEVTRRASSTQGVALLTLLSKGFSKPVHLDDLVNPNAYNRTNSDGEHLLRLSDTLKLIIRKAETPGHLPICWGVLTAALNLSVERSQYLHLFLQARSLLSAAIRLNKVGPYAAQQLLLHVVRDIVNSTLERCKDLRTGLQIKIDDDVGSDDIPLEGDFAASTWPLGEIIAARHDLLHSRIFNS